MHSNNGDCLKEAIVRPPGKDTEKNLEIDGLKRIKDEYNTI